MNKNYGLPGYYEILFSKIDKLPLKQHFIPLEQRFSSENINVFIEMTVLLQSTKLKLSDFYLYYEETVTYWNRYISSFGDKFSQKQTLTEVDKQEVIDIFCAIQANEIDNLKFDKVNYILDEYICKAKYL